MRKIIILLYLIMCVSTVHAASYPRGGRIWTYANLTTVLSPDWAVVVMPGCRYEFARSDPFRNVSAMRFYFLELFAGPVYTITFTPSFRLKLPLWYYYMGYPIYDTDDYYYSHNIEFLPIVELNTQKLTFVNRTIFHNTVYASIYETDELRRGYGLVLRQMLKLDYKLNERYSIFAAEELFWGVIEDKEAPPHTLGYWAHGFRMNRLYTGVNIRLTPNFLISPQYVYETLYEQSTVVSENHYLFCTFTGIVKLF